MNSLNIVALSLLNKHFVRIKIGIFSFKVYQPFIKDLARVFYKSNTLNEGIITINSNNIESMSRLIFRNVLLQRLFVWYVKRYSNFNEINIASKKIEIIIQGKDIFDFVKIDKVKSKKIIETVGNNSIAGIITTLMDSIHISYMEAFEKINYPTMLLMSVDKLRTLTGDEQKVVKTSGKEMMNRRRRK